MADIAAALVSKLTKVNWHKVVAGSLFGISVISLGAIALFGKVDSALPYASLPVPSLADTVKVQAGLRSHETDNNAYLGSEQITNEPRLAGISDPGHKTEPNNKPTTSKNQPQTPNLPVSAHALAAVPFSEMTEPGPGGLLPRIGPNGETSSNIYARPFELQSGKPVIAIVVGGLGMMKSTTMAAIEGLPPEVTLSFVPYTPELQQWIALARSHGHEVMIELPMEPFGYPETDPGPYTLLSSASSAENTRRLEWLLSRATGYFGVTNYMGSKLTASENAMAGVFRNLNRRGLDFLYDGETRRSSLNNVAIKEGLTWSTADRIVDVKQTIRAIDDQLLRLEAMAIQNGTAIGKGFSWPVTIKQLKGWTASLEAKGYQLAPVSAVIKLRNTENNPQTAPQAIAKVDPKSH